jgi:hypothetical protein
MLRNYKLDSLEFLLETAGIIDISGSAWRVVRTSIGFHDSAIVRKNLTAFALVTRLALRGFRKLASTGDSRDGGSSDIASPAIHNWNYHPATSIYAPGLPVGPISRGPALNPEITTRCR